MKCEGEPKKVSATTSERHGTVIFSSLLSSGTVES